MGYPLINLGVQTIHDVHTLGAFTTYATINDGNNVLTPQKVFVSIAYFNLMRIPLMLFPHTLREVIKTYVSLKRITDFLNAEELDEASISFQTKNESNAIEIENASMVWDDSDRQILKNLSFQVPKGSLTAIVGVVGSGKSSILSAILGILLVTVLCNSDKTPLHK